MKKLRFVLFVFFLSTIFTSSCKKENEGVIPGCLLTTVIGNNGKTEHKYNEKGQRVSSTATNVSGVKTFEYFYTYNSSGMEETVQIKIYNTRTGNISMDILVTQEYSGKSLIKSNRTEKAPDGSIINESYYTYAYDSYNNITEQKVFYKKSGIWELSYQYVLEYTYSSSGKKLTEKLIFNANEDYLRTFTYHPDGKIASEITNRKQYNGYLKSYEDVKYEVKFEKDKKISDKYFVKKSDVYLLRRESIFTNTFSGEQLISVLTKTISYDINGIDVSPTPVRTAETTTTYTYECR